MIFFLKKRPPFKLKSRCNSLSPVIDREYSSVEAQLRHRMAVTPNDTESEEEPFLLPCLSPPPQTNASSSTDLLAETSGVHIITTIFGNHSHHRLIVWRKASIVSRSECKIVL